MKNVVHSVMMVMCISFAAYANETNTVETDNENVITYTETKKPVSNEPVIYYDDNNEAEYEQYVCDNAKAPYVSSLRAFFTRIGCSLLVNYLVVQEKIKEYAYSCKTKCTALLYYLKNSAKI